MTTLNTKPLSAFAIFVIIFGAVLCLAGFKATLAPVDLIFKLLHHGPSHADWTEHMRFTTGLMGAVTLGWGMTLLALARHTAQFSRENARAVWSSVLTGMFVWFVIDGLISFANGYWVNVISNTLIVVLLFAALKMSGVRAK